MSKSIKYNSIKNWAEDDRPREKLLNKGAKALSDAELLAILIGSGSRSQSAVDLSRQILQDMNNDLRILSQKSVVELTRYKGIGQAKAVSIVAAMELVRRKKFNTNDKVKISSSRQVYQEMYSLLSDIKHEEFWAVYLDRKNVIINKKQISLGGVSSTTVDTKIIFKNALDLLASGMILVHNHPSGSLNPSPQDIDLTKKIKDGSKMLDISLIDHIIIAGEQYYSFADDKAL